MSARCVRTNRTRLGPLKDKGRWRTSALSPPALPRHSASPWQHTRRTVRSTLGGLALSTVHAATQHSARSHAAIGCRAIPFKRAGMSAYTAFEKREPTLWHTNMLQVEPGCTIDLRTRIFLAKDGRVCFRQHLPRCFVCSTALWCRNKSTKVEQCYYQRQ